MPGSEGLAEWNWSEKGSKKLGPELRLYPWVNFFEVAQGPDLRF